MRANLAIRHYARSVALAARGARTAAASEQAAFEAVRATVPADTGWSLNKLKDVLAVASETLAARLTPTPAEAVPHWRQGSGGRGYLEV